MEEAAKVIGGVAGELVFFMRSFLLGFLMRLGYEPIIFFRRVFRQPKLLLDVQDVLFWTFGSFLMFGLLFRENNGTPRLFSLIGIAAGMALYQLGPAKLTGSLFCKIRKKRLKMQRRCHAWRKKRLERRKMEKKRLKKTQKESMIKRINIAAIREVRILTGKMAARRRANRKWIALALVTVVLLSVMTWIGGNSLAEQNAQNLAQQQLLEEKIAEEKARSKELDEYSEYMKTDEFAEWYAKEKLGLIHKNEIIFKGE